jgi:dTDP-4-dehydrorhamnose reductase
MKTALIGHTGFVGGNILEKSGTTPNTLPTFTDLYNSKNISEIDGKSYDLVVSAGAPAVVWYANQHPEEDMAALEAIMTHLKTVSATTFVLISSVDVYPEKERSEVDEDTVIDPGKNSPYGANRFALEEFVRAHFPKHLIVRLPGLYGRGIKKNFIYDLMYNNALEFTHADSMYQYYDLGNLSHDIQTALTAGITLLNIAAEPISARDTAKEVFGIDFENRPADKTPWNYNIYTKHAAVFGKTGHYLYSRAETVAGIKQFVNEERERIERGEGNPPQPQA